MVESPMPRPDALTGRAVLSYDNNIFRRKGMYSRKLQILSVVVLAAGAFLLSRSSAQDGVTGGTLKVAVCDVAQVFDGYLRGQELTSEFLERGQKLQAEDEQRLKSIDSLTSELEGLLEGSKEYESRFKQIQRLKIDRTVWMQYETALAERDRLRLTKEMYDEIMAAVRRTAVLRGTDIVLYHKREMETVETRAQLLQQMELRKVIYSSKAADITEQVLSQVNEAYRDAKQ